VPLRIGPAVVTSVLGVALASGCSGDDGPGDVADPVATSSSPTEATSPAEATESATTSTRLHSQAVVFHGGGGVSAAPPCGAPAPTYVSLHEEFDVDQEVRVDEVSPVGGGRLVGRVYVAPTAARGPNDGRLVVGGQPGFGAVDGIPEWRDRAPLQGRLLQPGAYVVFAQVRLMPGTRMDGMDVSYSDGDATGSSRLDVSASVSRKCRG
jgi:hypothetical protein